MKKLGLLLFALSISLTASAQIGSDTLTPEKKARAKINVIYGKKITQLPNYALSNALRDITNLAAIKAPYVTTKQLRAGMADTARVVYVWDAAVPSNFIYDPTDTTTPDDTITTVVFSGKRYKKVISGNVLTPEIWGAKADGVTDNYVPIQKALNYASVNKGAKIVFNRGTYLTSKTLKFKRLFPKDSAYLMRVTLQGAGMDVTTIKGTETFSGNLIEMNVGKYNFAQRENWVEISNMSLNARAADRCFYANYFSGLTLNNVRFIGGELENIKLGSEIQDGVQNTLNYSAYIKRCTFAAGTMNGGNSNGNIIANGVLFLLIEECEGDAGRYGIYLNNCSEATIYANKFEGLKRAALYIDGTAGASIHKVFGNYFSAYGGYDPNGVFDGKMYGILIKGTFPFNNNIFGNTFRVEEPQTLYVNFLITGATALRASATGDVITGVTSGAIGYLQGWVPGENRIQVSTTSGTFVAGEQFTHRQDGVEKGVGGTIASIGTNETYGIKAEGGFGSSSITDNTFTTLTTYGIHLTASYYNVIANQISGKTGIYTNQPASIISNNIYSPAGTTVVNDGGLANLIANSFTAGSSTGIINSENYFKSSVGFGNSLVQAANSSYLSYNTADQSTNFERAFLRWNTNTLTFGTEQAGTGTNRDMQLNAGSSLLRINASGDTKGSFNTGNTSLTLNAFQYLTGFTSGSQHQKLLSLNPTITQSGTGSYSALQVSVYEQTVGSGPKSLLRLGTNTGAAGLGTHTDKFIISNTGGVTAADIPEYADNAAAVTAGLVVGRFYRTADVLKVVH